MVSTIVRYGIHQPVRTWTEYSSSSRIDSIVGQTVQDSRQRTRRDYEQSATTLKMESENTDKRPVKAESVEMDEVLKAEHWVLPCSEIQDCADTAVMETRMATAAVPIDGIVARALDLLPPQSCSLAPQHLIYPFYKCGLLFPCGSC